jgi:hypothetical protein
MSVGSSCWTGARVKGQVTSNLHGTRNQLLSSSTVYGLFALLM